MLSIRGEEAGRVHGSDVAQSGLDRTDAAVLGEAVVVDFLLALFHAGGGRAADLGMRIGSAPSHVPAKRPGGKVDEIRENDTITVTGLLPRITLDPSINAWNFQPRQAQLAGTIPR